MLLAIRLPALEHVLDVLIEQDVMRHYSIPSHRWPTCNDAVATPLGAPASAAPTSWSSPAGPRVSSALSPWCSRALAQSAAESRSSRLSLQRSASCCSAG